VLSPSLQGGKDGRGCGALNGLDYMYAYQMGKVWSPKESLGGEGKEEIRSMRSSIKVSTEIVRAAVEECFLETTRYGPPGVVPPVLIYGSSTCG